MKTSHFNRFMKLLVCFIFAITSVVTYGIEPNMVNAATVITYPQPPTISASDKYSVKVDGISSFTYKTTAAARTGGNDTVSWTDFAFSGGSITVEVTKIGVSSLSSVIVRPLDLGITATINGNKTTFTISQPCKFSVEFNGSLTDKCFIFADTPEINAPSPTDTNVLYFGPGVHNIGKGVPIPANKDTVYIAGGAYVKGSFLTDIHGRNNIKILGRGILSGENIAHEDLNGMIRFYDTTIQSGYVSNSISVDGITMLDSFSFHIDLYGSNKNSADNPHIINNVKMIAWAYNTDGFHTTGYNQVNDLFIFNSDDALDVGQFTLGSKITNCVLWQNRAGASLLFSWVGKEDSGNTIVDNIDVIHFNEDELTWDNNYVFMANHGEGDNINNIYINNVRVEAFGGAVKRFLGLQLNKSPWSDPNTPYGSISNIHFKNIRIDQPTYDNVIEGYDLSHKIYDITFENLTIDGQDIENPTDANIIVNCNVSNIDFIQNNYANNGSFEADAATQTPSEWSTTDTDSADYTAKTGFITNMSYSGWYHGNHWSSSNYTVGTYQNVNLPNGLYTLSAAVKSSGGQRAAFMYIKNYGGVEIKENIPVSSEYQKICIPDVKITNGQCQIGFYSDANANNSISFDEILLYRQPSDTTPIESGETYKLVPKHSQTNGMCMGVNNSQLIDGANVEQQLYTAGDNQKWVVEALGGGYYKITSKLSNKSLDVVGGGMDNNVNVNQWGYVDSENQTWRIESTGDGFYKIVAKHSSKCLDVYGQSLQSGANIAQYGYVGYDNQKWSFIKVSATPAGIQTGKYYKITAKHSGKSIDVYGIGMENGTNINQWDYVGGDNQKWLVESTGDGYYKLLAKHSNKCIDVSGAGMDNGANINQWDYVGGDCQKWSIENTEDGYYRIIAKHSGKCIEVFGSVMNNVSNIDQWDYVGGDNQKWSFEEVT